MKWLVLLFLPGMMFANTLHIGVNYDYDNLADAARSASPGDTLLFHQGIYTNSQYVANLQGHSTAWITIKAAEGESVICRGGTQAWHLVNPAYVRISGIVFEQQTANGVNVDDGGDYSTPAHHIEFIDCIFRDMNASGNNDLLKLSGVDSFKILDCRFENGSAGGSGIDMVGCHDGEISGCSFENMGSNAIQAKGGTADILIARNGFKNCGHRAVNLGGSTGLPYFRPADAPYEAANLHVFANVFIGSMAPIAYVGCVNVEVVNNTIVRPEKWVIRILQETVDPDRFVECGDNSFKHNLIVINNLSVETNIGPNTRPETFEFYGNFWYNSDRPNWDGPSIPVTDPQQVINQNPNFVDGEHENFHLQPNSPAIGLISYDGAPTHDFDRHAYANPRSVGAFEGNPPTLIEKSHSPVPKNSLLCRAYPNPFNNALTFSYELETPGRTRMVLYDLRGRHRRELIDTHQAEGAYNASFTFAELPTGVYYYRIEHGQKQANGKVVLLR